MSPVTKTPVYAGIPLIFPPRSVGNPVEGDGAYQAWEPPHVVWEKYFNEMQT